VYRPNGKRTGEEGLLSDVVPKLFILPALESVFRKASNPDMHGDRPPSHSAHLAPSTQAGLSGACGQGL